MIRGLAKKVRACSRGIAAGLAFGGLLGPVSAQMPMVGGYPMPYPTPYPMGYAQPIQYPAYCPPGWPQQYQPYPYQPYQQYQAMPMQPWGTPQPYTQPRPTQPSTPALPNTQTPPAAPTQPGTPSAPSTPAQPEMSTQPESQPSMDNSSTQGTMSNPGSNDTASNFGAAPSAGTGGGGNFNANMFGDALGRRPAQISFGAFRVNGLIPVSGGVVGRQKMAEDANPMPRDRLILDYDYFSNAALGVNGANVNRVVAGFEKTFCDGRASIEVRVPFANTNDGSTAFGLQSRDIEMGDIRVTPRFLLWSSCVLNVGTGVGVYIPTSKSTGLRDDDGTPLVRFSSDSVTLSPYLGILFTPCPRIFTQFWGSADYDLGSNDVSLSNGRALVDIGRYRNGTQVYGDVQLGYWLIAPQDMCLSVRGMAPFVEAHYGASAGSSSTLNSGGFTISDGGRSNELNVTAGLLTQFNHNLSVQVGAVVPMNNADSRNFDWQVGVRVNYFFGPRVAEQAMFAP